MKNTLTYGLGWLLVLGACGSDGGSGGGDEVDCEAADVPTYETFGKAFIEEYCASCHAASVTGGARMGAPDDDQFDTLEEIQQKKSELRNEVSIEKAMPFGANSKKPSDAERAQFNAWMVCGAE